jgi:hypothetical protein
MAVNGRPCRQEHSVAAVRDDARQIASDAIILVAVNLGSTRAKAGFDT